MVTLTLLGKRDKSPNVWYEVCGYITTIGELADIFEMNHHTLRQRLRYGWDIAPACIIQNTRNLTFKDFAVLTADPEVEAEFKAKVEKHFNRPSINHFKK